MGLKNFICAITLFFSTGLYAQQTKATHHEFGVSLFSVKRLESKYIYQNRYHYSEASAGLLNGYFYKYKKGKAALRATAQVIGLQNFGADSQNGFEIGSALDEQGINFAVGIESVFAKTSHFQFYTGIESTLILSQENGSPFFESQTNLYSRKSFGLGPMLGFKIKLSPGVYFLFEGNFALVHTSIKWDTRTSKGFEVLSSPLNMFALMISI